MGRFLKESLGGLAVAIVLALTQVAPGYAETPTYEASKLEAFVVAAIKVDRLVEHWRPRIETAESEEAADELKQQANSELVSAVDETSGITMEEYLEINKAAQADPQLMAQLKQLYESKAVRDRPAE